MSYENTGFEWEKYSWKDQLNKTEMPEWLAEKVLEWTRNEKEKIWKCGNHPIGDLSGVWFHKLETIIYSPDGFFAIKLRMFKKGFQLYKSYPIWDEAGEGLEVALSEDHTKATIFKGQYYYPKDQPLDNIQAEIEAFYHAVYEAMRKEI